MEPPSRDPGAANNPSPVKVTKRARRGLEESTDMAVEPTPTSPISEGISFRDKFTGWNTVNRDEDVVLSDESDVEEADYDPWCPTIRIPDSEKLWVRRRFCHAIIVNTLDRCFPYVFMSRKLPQLWAKKGGVQEVRVEDARPEVDEDFGPWMQVKKNRRKSAIRTEAVPSGDRPAKDVKKGNSFSILTDKEGQEEMAGQFPKASAQPSTNINEEPLEEDLVVADNENTFPNSQDPIPPVSLPRGTSVMVELGLATSVQSPCSNPKSIPLGFVENFPLGNFVPPSDLSSKAPIAQLVSDPKQNQARVVHLPIPNSVQTSLKKGAPTVKNVKGSKGKAKDSAEARTSKPRDGSSSRGNKDGPVAMDTL
ncbi:hypothetical protein LINPERPRIM_LOCUS35405 [Linum perenne]